MTGTHQCCFGQPRSSALVRVGNSVRCAQKKRTRRLFDVPTGKAVANFDRDQLWVRLTVHPLFSVALTLLASLVIYRLSPWQPLQQVMVSTALDVCPLLASEIDYALFHEGGSLIALLLGPTTVALVASLYRNPRQLLVTQSMEGARRERMPPQGRLAVLRANWNRTLTRWGKRGEELWSNAKHSPIKNPITAK